MNSHQLLASFITVVSIEITRLRKSELKLDQGESESRRNVEDDVFLLFLCPVVASFVQVGKQHQRRWEKTTPWYTDE
jgi:hypothetical protein